MCLTLLAQDGLKVEPEVRDSLESDLDDAVDFYGNIADIFAG
ncbi:hypothetical protein A2U01_0115172, partial [Trifolium medium]|nr:hypothetical protein [Trifolium medium]